MSFDLLDYWGVEMCSAEVFDEAYEILMVTFTTGVTICGRVGTTINFNELYSCFDSDSYLGQEATVG